jgi:hypothetical protein
MNPGNAMNEPSGHPSRTGSWKQYPAWRCPDIPATNGFGWQHLGLILLLVAWSAGWGWFFRQLWQKQAGVDQWVVMAVAAMPAIALGIWAGRDWRRRWRYGSPWFHMATWPGTNSEGELIGTIVIPRRRLPFANGRLEIVCRDERRIGERLFSVTVWDAHLPLQPASGPEGLGIPVAIRIPQASPDASPDPETPLRFVWFLRLGPEGRPAEIEFLLPMFRE